MFSQVLWLTLWHYGPHRFSFIHIPPSSSSPRSTIEVDHELKANYSCVIKIFPMIPGTGINSYIDTGQTVGFFFFFSQAAAAGQPDCLAAKF